MSEFEKRRRAEYKRKRKNSIVVQTVVIVLLAVIALLSFAAYRMMDRTYYIEYTEDSSVDYKVYLKDNDFYDDPYLGKDQSYVSSLIDSVKAKFLYRLDTDAQGVEYEYSYSIEADLRVTDKQSGKVIFNSVEVIKPEVVTTQNSNNKLIISEDVDINYPEYNALVKRFVDTYKLTNASYTLVVTMRVNVISSSTEFSENNSNEHIVSLNIPMNSTTIEIATSGSVPSTENKIVANAGGILYKDVAKIASIVSCALALVALIILVIFIYTTRNTDINYAIKLKRIISSYRSYIQKINNPFTHDGYQVLMVDTFREMLEIRDTIQSPILMSENDDKTRTEFVITTNTKILYMFELKIDDYDLIYGLQESIKEEPEVVEEPAPVVVEEPAPVAVEEPAPEVVEEPATEAVEEPATEAVEEPAPEAVEDPAPEVAEEAVSDEVVTPERMAQMIEEGENTADYRIVDGKIVHVRFRTSFMSRLIQAGEEVQRYYAVIKNKLLSYKGVKSRSSFHFESFNKGKMQCAKLNVKGSTIVLNIALAPADYDMQRYRITDTSGKSKLDKVPLQIKVKSQRSLTNALYFIEEFMNKNEIPFLAEQSVDYSMPYETDEELVERGLIKVILPGGIELDEHSRIEKLDISALLSGKRKPRETIVVDMPDEHTHVVEVEFVGDSSVDEELVVAAVAEPTPELSEIEYVDIPDEVYEETPEHPGVEVIGVVWPERAHKNKIYRYDPNGEKIAEGDVVLVPTKDVAKNKDVIRKATVVYGNHLVDPEILHHSLKKVIAIIRSDKTES